MAENHTRSATYQADPRAAGATVVTLHGEMDLLAVLPLRARLDTLSAGPHPDLVIDLRAVSFIDCAGLGVLCRTRNRVKARRGRLRLVADDALFLRTLRCTGLSGVFDIAPA
ncbi:STAS domain-containing protein [Streptomyces sp. NBC_00015]|uniref:STAS domain-containing protein n=1 Tax=unclassified Streptomyces TaxID=2593676 RepID=UPI0022575F6F|nr:STAS domain-containing protein [Streptomyces sp. NBC_00103]MCX5373510.1 STAS domain-containing protein [Streptomyces sp. NBC_00103]